MTSTKGKLIEDEELERGSVSYQVYFFYARNIGWLVMSLLVLCGIIETTLQVYNGFWVSEWSEAGLTNPVSASILVKNSHKTGNK